ncbi:DUF4126 domain-containing protein [Gloeocapsopsis dulcis]|uniref:DUF4126 domain-containing protein n=1 Tax=Gloeocapsopsis dulcis AAB1 = 1H9 TaxID=1433147 RepID=A0A6N8FUC4_9CHRO|nr:DUF4126 domain-containing protein [Gloeocapsopsis dulcis]MUL36718.1 DUF4126 domain-containing protein [Gloeocapsopsis dulcis AAB1 = 1H9]WNN91292.1 DUF4126 domain-containing protein [Gloeocapsopsis dulcis]
MIELLAALSAAAAASMRIAVPLFIVGILLHHDFSLGVPLFTHIPSVFIVSVLISGSLLELVGSKQELSQRLLQLVQLIFSPIVGAILAISVTTSGSLPSWLFGVIGALFAFALQLVQAGWFYRLRGFRLWVVVLQDALCILLVVLAVNAPQIGGLIALMLLLIAVRSVRSLHRWYKQD